MPFITYHLKDDNPDFARYTTLLELIDNGSVNSYVNIHRNSHRYNHEMTMKLEDDSDGIGMWDKETIHHGILQGALVTDLMESIDAVDMLLPKLDAWMIDEARRYAVGLYKALGQSHDEYSSEEYFTEICAINEWRFDANGNLV